MAFSWVELVRVIHVLAAVVWAGGALFGLVMVGPNVRAAGEAGQRFMQVVGKRGGFAKLLGPAGIVTVLSGLVLFWQYGYSKDPFASPSMTALTLGALLGLSVLVVGTAVGLPMQKRMAALAGQVGPGGPTPEQAAGLATLGRRLMVFGTTFTWLLMAALVLMVGRRLVS